MKKKADPSILVKIVEFERLKVADEDKAGQFMFFEPGKVIEGLGLSSLETATCAFLFYKENALPEKIEEAALLTEKSDGLFKTCDTATRYAKDFKEFIVESLTLASFVVPVFPFFREARGADSDFVPTEVHG